MRDDIFRQDDQYDQMSTPDLLKRLQEKNILSRTRSLAALARRVTQDRGVVEQVVKAISDPENMHKRLMGTISISHIGFACLWENGSTADRVLLYDLLNKWPEPDRTDLLWFLESQSILVEPN